MSKAKPTHMRPILEDVVDAGVISPELRKAIKWSLVTIDDLTQRLAAAEAALNLSTDERQTAEVRCEELTERLAAAEARIQTLREAIKPFAEFAKLLDDFDDEHSVIRRKDWLVSDHRKAAAAYGDD